MDSGLLNLEHTGSAKGTNYGHNNKLKFHQEELITRGKFFFVRWFWDIKRKQGMHIKTPSCLHTSHMSMLCSWKFVHAHYSSISSSVYMQHSLRHFTLNTQAIKELKPLKWMFKYKYTADTPLIFPVCGYVMSHSKTNNSSQT